jgi:hypothetical protein
MSPAEEADEQDEDAPIEWNSEEKHGGEAASAPYPVKLTPRQEEKLIESRGGM